MSNSPDNRGGLQERDGILNMAHILQYLQYQQPTLRKCYLLIRPLKHGQVSLHYLIFSFHDLSSK